MRWQPVSATVPHVITDNTGNPGVSSEIVLPADAQVTFELRLSDWGDAVGSPELGTYVSTVDGVNSYSSGSGDPLEPLGGCCPGDPASCFIDIEHPAYVFGDLQPPCIPLYPVALSTLDYEIGGTILGGCSIPDDGSVYYGGTLILTIPPGAAGTYTIDFVPLQEKTFMNDPAAVKIEPLTLTAALITIGAPVIPCCLPDGSCSLLSAEDCTGGGGLAAPECLGDNDSNGTDDVCEADCDGDTVLDIEESDPTEKDCDYDGICNGVEIENCPPDEPSCDDCNDNDIPDECDITGGTSEDCQPNDIPDDCESDCNDNGVADECDITDGTSDDCTGNNVPDDCEVAPDCNVNGSADYNDLCNHTSFDCNQNGVPDECDISLGTSEDTNDNNIPDECDGPPTFAWVPARATGYHVINGNEITIEEGGQLVTLEARLSGWSNATGMPELGAYQVTVDSSGYHNGVGTPLGPLGGCCPGELVSCYIASHICAESGRSCVTPFEECGPSEGECIRNWDWVLDFSPPCMGLAATSVWNLNYELGGASLGGCFAQDVGLARYGGTLILDVPLNAAGTYTIDFVDLDVKTFMNDPLGLSIQPLTLTPASITIGPVPIPCCLPDGSCAMMLSGACVDAGGSAAVACLGDANINGVDDGCEADCDDDMIPDIDEANPAEQDCDLDGICNGVEIDNCPPSEPSCNDCNGNGLPDECDLEKRSKDCNGNRVPDECDITDGTSTDCTGDGIPDECEPDCNDNDVPDECDVDPADPDDNGQVSEDCTNNGIPDECEPDCNDNDTADSCDILNLISEDCQANGIPDECEVGGCCLDVDEDELYESCDNGTAALCELAGGIFRGPCHPCPDQNVMIIPEPGGEVFVHVIGAPIDCLAETRWIRRDCPPDAPKIDPWKSDADAQMCHNFGVMGSPAIPGDFFNAGSDPFARSICLEGLPLGHPGFPNADTLIERSADPFDRCAIIALPTVAAPVDVEVVALSLVSVAPITVTYGIDPPDLCDGVPDPDQCVQDWCQTHPGQCEEWSVAVDLSEVQPPLGSLTATKTHCNGGTYTSVLIVQPRCTFTKVDQPGEVRILDTGLAGGYDPITLDQQDPASWVIDPDPNLGLEGDPCSDFHAGIDDPNPVTDCDCNGNSIRDRCDVEDTTSQDCNENDVPDECELDEDCNVNGVPDACEPDCQPNGVPDECDIAVGAAQDCNSNTIPDWCDLRDGTGLDCQPNSVPDDCDITSGRSGDTNSNGIPDECEAQAPAAEPGGPACTVPSDCMDSYAGAGCVGGICYVPKNRHLSIDPTTNEAVVAYQVEITEAADYPTAVGRTWWVDTPVCYDYPNGDPIPGAVDCTGPDVFGWVSKLKSTAVFRAWVEVPLHISACATVPGVTYHIRAKANAGVGFSNPLEINTTHAPAVPQYWGDLTGGPVDGMPGLWLAPEGFTNLADVQAGIRTFENRSEDTGFPPRVWVDVETNRVVNLADIQFLVMAFEGVRYEEIEDLEFIGVHPADCP